MSRPPAKTTKDRTERLYLCFSRLASIGRDLQHLSSPDVTPAQMESFKLIAPSKKDRPSDGTLLWVMPANVQALQQKHYVDRALEMLYFNVDLIESQVSLLQRPKAGFSAEEKAQIGQTMNRDAGKFIELQKCIFDIVEAHRNDPMPERKNQTDAAKVHAQINQAHNDFTYLLDDQYREEGEYIEVRPSVRNASKSDLLFRIHDSRAFMLDSTMDVFELKMSFALNDIARVMQWKVLSQDNPNLMNEPLKRQIEQASAKAYGAYPELMAGFHAMNAFFHAIAPMDEATGVMKPIKDRYVAASVADLPQITP